ncbi:hypothetical protein [Nocardioides sp. KR10-350]|uniref:hypothetical protein n=1 Tax=Nocardioides cheoyonin TaxID=3156615 RepID=UPI0032B4B191
MPTATIERPSAPARPPEPSRSAVRVRWGVLAVLAALLLASLGYLGWHIAGDGESADGSQSLVSDRETVQAVAKKFIVTVNTYDPSMLGKDGKTMPSYRSAVEKMLTAKFRTQFEQNVPYAEATVSTQGAGRSAEVYATGVPAIDDDTATVMVAGQLTVTYPKSKNSTQRVKAGNQIFRVEVDLVKSHGDWLVDNWGAAEQAPTSTGGSGVAQ